LRSRTILGVVALIVCLAGLSAPSKAVGLAPHYFQKDMQGDRYIMDTVMPASSAGSAPIEMQTAEFITRPLTASFTYTEFDLKLYYAATKDTIVTFYVGWYDRVRGKDTIYTQTIYAKPSETSVEKSFSVQVEVDQGSSLWLKVSTGEGLGLAKIQWGDSVHPSYLATQEGPYQGAPIPEFSDMAIQLLLVTSVFAVFVFTRGFRQRRTIEVPRY
jgi:hypothetical protein